MKAFKISELVETTKQQRDQAWLERALQYAIQLEFFTIPPYLTAFWSIKNPRETAAIAIREVLVEEMLHMSLACNMLKSIGGCPIICHPDVVPKYPNPLPGGVKPGLRIALEGLSKHTLDVFMAIEEPEKDISVLETTAVDETFPRIGAFYDAIEEAFYEIGPEISRAGQIEGYFGESRRSDGTDVPKNIGSLEEVSKAIKLIKDQGEGTSQSPFDPDTGELAHYYRFKEIAVGRKIVQVPGKGFVHSGEAVNMPDCWPVGEVPLGGYQQAGVPKSTWSAMECFDAIYTQLLMQLDLAWKDGSQAALHRGLELMMDRLPALATEIMQVSIGNKPTHYAPNFRLTKTEGFNGISHRS